MKFGQYELLERIAVGGMAEVYRGRVAGAEGFEKLVAIKRVLPEFARDERFISMLLTEARIHSALSHRNIVQIHDLGISEDGEYFIVLEYVEGHDLRAVMEAATALGVQIPDSLALHIADELAQALHFAHELKDADGHPLGIVHRDVSPSNVLLSNSGEVKLSDFGIAKRQHDHSVVGALKGNLVYMSPEQARKATVDRRTDVFSLGAVLFEMVTGQKLRDITNEVDGWRDVASGAIPSARDARPDIPEAFNALLARALAPDPADRFLDAASFGAAIRELRREGDAPAGPNDIKELIEVLDPPRHARSPVERSKVIRLGPEFKVPVTPPKAAAPSPSEALAMAAAAQSGNGTAPGPTAKSVVSPRVEMAFGLNKGGAMADANANVATPLPVIATPKTPPLVTPPLPVLAPPAIVLAPPPSAPTNGSSATNGYARNGSGKGLGAALLSSEGVTPPPPSAVTPPPPVIGDVPIDAAAMATPPPLGVPAPSMSGPNFSGPAGSTVKTLQGSGPMNAPFNTQLSASAPVALPPKKSALPLVVGLLVVIAAAAAVVHVKVMPLGLLAVWTKPAALQVSSEPAGADITLDGRPVLGQTPTRVQVKRDRAEHVVEASKTGFKPARQTIRFDRTTDLSASLTLEALPPPPPPPPPVAKEEPTKPDEKVAAKAEEPAAKTAAPGDEETGKKGKKGKKAKKGKKGKKGNREKKAKKS
ncbi:MAG TPA: serine/threonine-protein kinase [Polyangia bacterium]|jgi:serine/threonine protein kinase